MKYIFCLISFSIILSSLNAAPFCAEKVAQIRTQFEKMNLTEGVGHRGMLANELDLTFNAESRIAAFGLGINFWNQRIGVVPSIEAALTNDKNIPNFLAKSVYVLSDIDPNKIKPEEIQAAFQSALDEGVYEINADGKVQKWKDEDVQRLINLKITSASEFSEYTKSVNGLLIRGWFFPKIRGVTFYKDIERSSISVRKNARRHLREGMMVTFNSAFPELLVKIGKLHKHSRYTADYQAMLSSLFKSGYAYSAEVWDKNGNLVGGEVGLKYKNLYKADSVWYDHERFPEDGFEFAQTAGVAVLDRLHDEGIDFVDTGMVTRFSKQLKAVEVSPQVFLQNLNEIQSLPEVPVGFSDISWRWIEKIRLYDPGFLGSRSLSRLRGTGQMRLPTQPKEK